MKPFTSKHCMQYLTKESPLNQVQDPAQQKLKKEYRKKTGPTGIAPKKEKFVPTKK